MEWFRNRIIPPSLPIRIPQGQCAKTVYLFPTRVAIQTTSLHWKVTPLKALRFLTEGLFIQESVRKLCVCEFIRQPNEIPNALIQKL